MTWKSPFQTFNYYSVKKVILGFVDEYFLDNFNLMVKNHVKDSDCMFQ